MDITSTSPATSALSCHLAAAHKKTRTWRSSALTFGFSALLVSGLYLEFFAQDNWNAGALVLITHLLVGLAFVALLLFWIIGHVRRGLVLSERRSFTWLSWGLLTKYLLVIGTGLLMAVPPGLYLFGKIWFWSFEATYVLTFIHLWVGIAAALGMVEHLGMRHWRWTGRER